MAPCRPAAPQRERREAPGVDMDGPAAVRGTVPLLHLGDSEIRTWVFDPAYEDWRLLEEGCRPPEHADLFAADGEVWRSWTDADGAVLRWAPLLPE